MSQILSDPESSFKSPVPIGVFLYFSRKNVTVTAFKYTFIDSSRAAYVWSDLRTKHFGWRVWYINFPRETVCCIYRWCVLKQFLYIFYLPVQQCGKQLFNVQEVHKPGYFFNVLETVRFVLMQNAIG